MLYDLETARLDVTRRQLIREGREQHLAPKAFQLLLALLEVRPQVLSKADLMSRLWPDTFVSDANLAVLIGEVRAAIGDSARNPRLIKTHHRVGYSFAGKAVEIEQPEDGLDRAARIRLRIGRRRLVLPRGAFVVGRDRSCEIVLTDPSVSRHHARIHVRNGKLAVEDLNSKNGTRIGARPVSQLTAVKHGEILTFGNVSVEVEFEDSTEPETVALDESD
jgi:DNA-binding winged helix-turn-helix (wHTH) protein